MPRQTIDYSTHTDPVEKKAAAINDIMLYLGVDRYRNISKDVKANPVSRKSFIMQLSMFVGIDGYPAEAWADELGLVDTDAKES